MSAPPEYSQHFRRVLGTFCSGVTIVAAATDSVPAGLTCQSFFSVSIEPPLVAFSVARASTSFPAIRRSGKCCINILASDQAHLSGGFGRSGADKWHGISWQPSRVLGNPVIEGVLSWIDSIIEAEHDAGDHTIIIGRIVDMAIEREAAPLLFNRGGYCGLPHWNVSRSDR